MTPARNHDGPSVWKSCRRRPKLTGYSAAELQDVWFWYVEWDRQPSNHEWEGHSAQASEAEWVYRFAHLQTQQYVKARHGESMYNHLYALNMEPAHRAEKPGSRVRRLYDLLHKRAAGLIQDHCARRTSGKLKHYDIDWAAAVSGVS